MKSRIYLDAAATAWERPREVETAVRRAIAEGGNPGRGGHSFSRAASETVYLAREVISDFFALGDPERVVFTANTTEALNLALRGVLKHGDHVILSDLEHNAVFRQAAALEEAGEITYDLLKTAGCEEPGILSARLEQLLRPTTRAIVTVHASNICSRSLPLSEIGRFAEQHGLYFIVDGAQSAGHLKIDMEQDAISMLAIPGHKGLFGIPGCGALLLSRELSKGELPLPLRYGGSGVASLSPKMPAEPPERYEAGTLPLPAIAGMSAGIGYLQRLGLSAVSEKEERLFLHARERFSDFSGIRIYAPKEPGAVFSFAFPGIPSEEIAQALDKDGIAVRAGFHCAALAHKTLKTDPDIGALRMSFSYFTEERAIERAARTVERFLQERH